MSLVTCKECGKQFSDELKKCINCGTKRPKTKKENIIDATGAVIAISLLAYCQAHIDTAPQSTKLPLIGDTVYLKSKTIGCADIDQGARVFDEFYFTQETDLPKVMKQNGLEQTCIVLPSSVGLQVKDTSIYRNMIKIGQNEHFFWVSVNSLKDKE